jgi:hypothetical protein
MSYNETQFINDLDNVLNEIRLLLIEKNRSYGNSALEPLKIMSKASAAERLKIRMDDKLSRLFSGNDSYNEDTILDLIGYLVLDRIAHNRETIGIISAALDMDITDA